MNYFTLPHFYYCNKINQYFSKFSKDDAYLRPDFRFVAVSGSYPYCYWNGSMNSFEGPLELKDTIINHSNSSILPLRFNCSNINLKTTDYKDSRMNKILEVCQTGSNYIEVSDLDFFDYLKNKFPEYKYIFSSNANEVNEYNVEILNAILEQDIFDLVQVPVQFNNIEFLKNVKNRSKLEVTTLKPNYCPDYQKCLVMEQQLQYNFSENSYYKRCNKCTSYTEPMYMTWEDIHSYNTLGINNFKIAECGTDEVSKNNYILYLVNMFIKDDKKVEFTNNILKDKGAGII